MAETVYAATGIEKLVAEHDPGRGASTEVRCTMSERINVVAGSLPGLIDAICKSYYLDREDFIGPDPDGKGIDNLNFTTLERGDCNKPSDAELKAWEAGKLKLYCCDYRFTIEKRAVSNIDADEFEGLDTNTH